MNKKKVYKQIREFLSEYAQYEPNIKISDATLKKFLSLQPRKAKTQKRNCEEWKKNNNLDEFKNTIQNCTLCPLSKTRHNVVFGEGNHNAELMFIGEGPGRDEDLQGRPFVGRAGQLLDKMIAAMTYKREEVYIANIVKCRPPENRAPEPDEANSCLPFLIQQIELIKPKVIVLLGATPAKFLLGVKTINEVRGKWQKNNQIKIMPTYHPAFLLRNPEAKKIVWDDLKLVMKELGRKIQN